MSVKKHTSTVSAKFLEPVIQLARHYPLTGKTDQVEELLTTARLTADEFNKPGARFPDSQLPVILDQLAKISQNPLIALTLGEATQPQVLGSVGFMMSTAATLEIAYQVLIDYLPLLHEGALIQIDRSDDSITLSFELNEPHPQVIDYFMSCLVNWPRQLTGQQIPARVIRLNATEPERVQPYQQHFAAEIEFSAPRNQLEFSSEYLNQPCVEANPEMHQLHRDFADTLMTRIGLQNALTAQTRNMIRQHLTDHRGLIRREEVAETLGMSLRTFQRKLGEQGASFQGIYDQTRKELCLQLIQRGQHSFGEISYQLGFSNQSAFQKAFKRWTQTTPSHYRTQIQPELQAERTLPTSGDLIRQEPVPQTQAELEIALSHLTLFCRDLLEKASICGEQFDLRQISAITSDPIARLAIHLWPPEQSQLITCLDESENRTQFQFTNKQIWEYCYQNQSSEVRETRHGAYVSVLLSSMSESPTEQDYQRLFEQIKLAKKQINAADFELIFTTASDAIEMATSQRNYALACEYQYELLTLDNGATPNGNTEHRYRYAELLFLSGQIETAQQQISSLKGSEPRFSGLQARIYQHQGQHLKALHLLLNVLDGHAVNMPNDNSRQLDLLVSHLHHIHDYLNNAPQPVSVQSPKHKENNVSTSSQILQVLEQVCLLSRKLNHPLLSACAITHMVLETIKSGPNSHSAFSFASFAWVASWFCADITTAKQSAQLSRLYLMSHPHGITNHLSTSRPLDPSLILSSQVEHWLLPVEKVKHHLNEIISSCSERHLILEKSESVHLSLQLQLFRSGDVKLSHLQAKIERQLTDLNDQGLNHQHSVLAQSSYYLVGRLRGSSSRPLAYQQAWSASAELIAAFWLQEDQHWPEVLGWEAQLENELPGYFCLSEAFFAAAMIKVQQAQQRGTFSRKREQEFSQTCSRFEIWASECPDNFAAQHLLLEAEYARFKGEDAGPLFDHILSRLECQTFSYLLPLTYHRYGEYLQHQKQPQIAKLCLEKAKHFYAGWEAKSLIKLVDQSLALLAK